MQWSSSGFFKAEILAPVIVGILTGLGGSWLTVNTQIAELEGKVRRNGKDITRLRTQQKIQSKEATDTSERLVRLETKVDLLLENQGIQHTEGINRP